MFLNLLTRNHATLPLANANRVRSQVGCIFHRHGSFLKGREEVKNRNKDESPTKFSESYAGNAEIYKLREMKRNSIPPSQKYWVLFSFYSILVYFAILREENDIDKWSIDTIAQIDELEEEEIIYTLETETYSSDLILKFEARLAEIQNEKLEEAKKYHEKHSKTKMNL